MVAQPPVLLAFLFGRDAASYISAVKDAAARMGWRSEIEVVGCSSEDDFLSYTSRLRSDAVARIGAVVVLRSSLSQSREEEFGFRDFVSVIQRKAQFSRIDVLVIPSLEPQSVFLSSTDHDDSSPFVSPREVNNRVWTMLYELDKEDSSPDGLNQMHDVVGDQDYESEVARVGDNEELHIWLDEELFREFVLQPSRFVGITVHLDASIIGGFVVWKSAVPYALALGMEQNDVYLTHGLNVMNIPEFDLEGVDLRFDCIMTSELYDELSARTVSGEQFTGIFRLECPLIEWTGKRLNFEPTPVLVLEQLVKTKVD